MSGNKIIKEVEIVMVDNAPKTPLLTMACAVLLIEKSYIPEYGESFSIDHFALALIEYGYRLRNGSMGIHTPEAMTTNNNCKIQVMVCQIPNSGEVPKSS